MRFGSTSGSRLWWAYLSMAVAHASQPAVFVLLARVLDPSDLGVLTMALSVLTFAELFRDMGLSQAIIKHPGSGRDLANNAFWAQLAFGTITFTVIWSAAPLMGMYYQEAHIVPVLRIMGTMFLLYPFVDIPYAFLLRHLDFRAIFLRQAVPALAGGAVSIALGYTGFGIWSLVVGMLVGRIVAGAASLWAGRWLPSLMIDPRAIVSMLRFSLHVSLQGMLGWVIVWSDRWFVGRFLGAHSLGIYQVGMRLGELPFIASGAPISLVAYPVMARSGGHATEVRRTYLYYLRGISLIAFPLGVALAALMPVVVPKILGRHWGGSVEIFQLLVLSQTLGCIVSLNPEVFKALGRPELMSRFMLLRAVVSIPAYFFAARAGLGALALAHLLLVVGFAPVNMLITMHALDIRPRQVVVCVRTGVVAASGTALVALLYWKVGIHVVGGVPGAMLLAASLVLTVSVITYVLDGPTLRHLACLAHRHRSSERLGG